MKLKGKRLVFLGAIAVCSCLAGMIPLVVGSPKKPNALHLVKKIYVAEWPYLGPYSDPQRQKELADEATAEKVRKTYLEAELLRVGFNVVRDKETADAVLSGYWGVKIVTDGGTAPDPTEYTFTYHLTPPRNASVSDSEGEIWKSEVRIQSKTFGPELDRQAASRIVAKLVKAWVESAKKAEVPVSDWLRER